MTATASQSVEDALKMLRFSDYVQKDTRQGPRLIRSALITPYAKRAFWGSYEHEKAEWAELGYFVTKFNGTDWRVVQSLNLDYSIPGQAYDYARRAREEQRDPKALPADWTPEDVTLNHEVSTKLLDYQRPAAMRLVRALTNGNALDASDTGVGKTFVALAVAAELGMTPCVIAPLAVLPSWKRAAEMLGVRLGWLINYDKLRTGRSGLGRWRPRKHMMETEDTIGKGSAMGQEFSFEYLPGQKPLLVFDEAQKSKSSDSKQGAILRDGARAGHKILCLSATAAKDPTEMRNLGAALGLHDGSHSGWVRFCLANGCVNTPRGLKFDNRNRRLLEKIHRQIFPLKGNRIRVADLPEFPETQILAETLTCDTDAISAAYRQMEEQLQKIESESGLTKAEKGAQSLAEITKARVAAEKGKLKLFAELAEEAIEEGRSVAIFLNFRDHIGELMEKLDTKCVVWGGQKGDERQNCIDDFQADRSRVIIVSLQAGGAGLSLHDLNGNHPRLAIISPSFSAIDLKQALGRCHRAGAKTKSFQRIIFAAGTIEEEVCSGVREKLTNIDKLNDGELAPPSILKHALPQEAAQPELTDAMRITQAANQPSETL